MPNWEYSTYNFSFSFVLTHAAHVLRDWHHAFNSNVSRYDSLNSIFKILIEPTYIVYLETNYKFINISVNVWKLDIGYAPLLLGRSPFFHSKYGACKIAVICRLYPNYVNPEIMTPVHAMINSPHSKWAPNAQRCTAATTIQLDYQN